MATVSICDRILIRHVHDRVIEALQLVAAWPNMPCMSTQPSW